MSHTLTILAICFVVVASQLPCKVKVIIESKTNTKFRAEISVPSANMESKPVVFDKLGEKMNMMVESHNCDGKPWVIRTMSLDKEKGEWVAAKNITAKFLGNGWIRVLVGDDLQPQPNDRMGVFCSEGNCGK